MGRREGCVINISEYHAIITDAWHLLKDYIPDATITGDKDEFWQQLILDAGQVARKHDHSRFVKALILAVTTEIEEVYREWKAKQ